MKLDKNKVREMAGKPPEEEKTEKTSHVEPNRSRKRKQFTLSDISRERLEYLKKYHGTSESVIVDMAISQFYIHTINEIKPLKEKE